MRWQTDMSLRRCTSYFVCFSLLLQTTGISAALPLPERYLMAANNKQFSLENDLKLRENSRSV